MSNAFDKAVGDVLIGILLVLMAGVSISLIKSIWELATYKEPEPVKIKTSTTQLKPHIASKG